MSEQDNTPEHGHEPVASPTPEPAPEPAATEPAAAEQAHEPEHAPEPEHTAEAELGNAPEPEPDHAAAQEAVAEVAQAPESSNEPAHEPVVASSNEPAHDPAPEADHPVTEATDHSEPEPAPVPTDVTPEALAEPDPASTGSEPAHAVEAEAEAEAPTDPVPPPAADPEPVHAPDANPTEDSSSIDPAVVAAGVAAVGAAAAAVGAAAAANSAQSRPIWSDQGDAPFDDGASERPAGRDKRERAERESGGFFAELFDIVRTVVYALLIALVVRVFFFQPFTIPSASMEPNLYEGDYIVVSKWSYGYSRHSMPWSPPLFEGRLLSHMAERGDIVVFKRPNNDGQGYTDYIKRVIGLPGDTVQMISNRLYINGEQVQDVVVEAAQVRGAFQGQTPIQLRETLPGGHEFRIQDFGPGSPSDDTDAFTVPDGHYFVMGDNRDDSMDSRYVWEAGGVGLVPHENLVGKAQVILFSWTPGATLFNPVSWFTHVRTERFFTDLE